MRKFTVRLIAMIAVITLLPIFSACGNKEKPDSTASNEYHKITFNTNGGTKISDMEVRHGTMAAAPKDPTMENYVFCRWQTTEGRAFFFEYYNVEEDLNLEAIWIKATDLFALEPMPDSDGVMITKIKRQEEINNLVIPSVINGKTVEGIGDEAFEFLLTTHAKKMVFPDTIRYIGSGAFQRIVNVELQFDGKVSYLGEEAFLYCTPLKQLKLAEGLETIPFSTFAFCENLLKIDIPTGVTVIEENAFESCSSLQTVVLPATLEKIENGAFDGCDDLRAVFFKGTEEQFDELDITLGNEKLAEVDVYFYSETEPAEEGVYWHYDKNESPIIW